MPPPRQQEQETPGFSPGSFMPVHALRTHWRKGVTAALLIIIIGTPVAYQKRDKFQYSVDAKIYVAPRFATVLSEQKETDFDSYQKWRTFQDQQSITVKRYDIVLDALKHLNAQRKKKGEHLIWFPPPTNLKSAEAIDSLPFIDEEPLKREAERIEREQQNNAPDGVNESIELTSARLILDKAKARNDSLYRGTVERLVDEIHATAVKDSYLINVTLDVTMDGDFIQPFDALINKTIQVYMDKQRNETFYSDRDTRLSVLNQKQGEITERIDALVALRTGLAQKLGVTTFSDGMENPFDGLLLESQKSLAVAERDLIQAKGALAVYQDGQGRENRMALDAASFANVVNDPGLNTLKSNFNERRSRLLEQLSGLDQSHPQKQNIDQEIKDSDAEIGLVVEKTSHRFGDMLLQQRKDDVRKAQEVFDGIKRQVEECRLQSAKFSGDYNKALAYTNEIARHQSQLGRIENRKDELSMESNAPSMVRWESMAVQPEKGKGGFKKYMISTLVASIVFGLGLPLVIDWLKSRKEIRTTDQVRKLFGYNPLAAFCEAKWGIAEQRAMADKKRRLALALAREYKTNGNKTFFLTSATPHAGVTGLAMDLAIEFGDLGIKALVVEVNSANPDARYLPESKEIHQWHGLVDLIGGDGCPIHDTILSAQGMLPDRIGIGLSPNSHLFQYDKLEGIFNVLLNEYNVIFFDGPPVLFSADAEFFSSNADHVLFLTKACGPTPGELLRAVSILQRCDPKTISFIVTNLKIYVGNGYYADLKLKYDSFIKDGNNTINNYK